MEYVDHVDLHKGDTEMKIELEFSTQWDMNRGQDQWSRLERELIFQIYYKVEHEIQQAEQHLQHLRDIEVNVARHLEALARAGFSMRPAGEP